MKRFQIPVSYTHLDVYKRQRKHSVNYIISNTVINHMQLQIFIVIKSIVIWCIFPIHGREFFFHFHKADVSIENFRVRKLRAINALNFYITLCMAFLAMISMESETSAVKVSIIKSADPVKRKVYFCYYLLAKGIRGILSYTKEGVRLWFRTKRPAYRQICLKLVA